MTKGLFRLLAVTMVALVSACGGGGAPPGQLPARASDVVVEDFMIGSREQGIELYLRNKHPAALYDVKADKTVLFVHGASYPAHASFDLAIDGQSWMDWLARRGYDVYSLDLQGYGKSTRPTAMNQPPEANGPVVDTTAAAQDVSKAVEFILSRRNSQKLVLVGWSWGATVVGLYASEVPDKVERLVLYAPQWLRDGTLPANVDASRLGAWRRIWPKDAREAWLKGVPEAKRDAVLPKAAFDTWLAATVASDPQPGQAGSVRAPNGVVADTLRYWAAGKPRWDPSRVTAPTLVVQGEWDAEAPPAMGQALFAKLTRVPMKRYVMLGESTHAALIESNRFQLFRAVQEFLEEPVR
jgi:pimeloyl-ACP methyl ester carboxylesterase